MKKGFGVLLMLLVVVSSCSSANPSGDVIEGGSNSLLSLAQLKTYEAESIEYTSAIVSGKIDNTGGSNISERGVCYGKAMNPDYGGLKNTANLVMGSGEFKSNLKDLEVGTIYFARAYAINKIGIAYGNQITFKTNQIVAPLLVFGKIKVAGAQDLFFDVELKEPGTLTINEIGVVYNTAKEPTIANNKIKRVSIENNFKQRITNLKPETTYYVRPYVITPNGVLYGEEIAINTIKKGNFTYSFNQNGADVATVNRIKAAFDSAISYYNNFTSIVKHVTVNYSPGTPTADANFSGWINMGASQPYQKTGTVMHEIAHTLGVGQHAKYWQLMYDGVWHGTRANDILKMMTNDSNATVKGDKLHFWPYGINGHWEDDGTDFLYMMNALILQGMNADGMPSN